MSGGRVIFRTETGSMYEIDYDAKTWTRLEPPLREGGYPLRTANGTYNTISDIEVGKSVEITGPPVDPKATFRLIQTSPVEEILSTSQHAVD